MNLPSPPLLPLSPQRCPSSTQTLTFKQPNNSHVTTLPNPAPELTVHTKPSFIRDAILNLFGFHTPQRVTPLQENHCPSTWALYRKLNSGPRDSPPPHVSFNIPLSATAVPPAEMTVMRRLTVTDVIGITELKSNCL